MCVGGAPDLVGSPRGRMTLTVRFWGTRGSVPSPGPETVRYGGNTACVEVGAPNGGILIFDAGTGIRELGDSLLARAAGRAVACDLLLSHLHWDHVHGLPFFAPLYERTTHLRVWTAQRPDDGVLERVVRGLMSPAVFPITFEQVGATVEFCARPRAPWMLGGCEVDVLPVQHPGGAFGYRLRVDGAPRLVYIPDNELRAPASPPAADRGELVAFCAGAGLLIHDSTYTAAEYARRAGWGHSTLGDAVALALEAGVEHLVLFHHAPGRRDAELDELLEQCRAEVARRGGALEVTAAREGLSIEM